MKCYMAPMEGITGYVYRNAHHKHFGNIEEYYTPFITPNQTRKFTSREMNDVLPEHNIDIPVIPQTLTNNKDDFLWASRKLKELGYSTVNLNLGCPSGTVVTKKRGAGFLAEPMELDQFLYEVVNGLEQLGMKLSLKTRIGIDETYEFEDLLSIYNRYSLERLIVHPRLRIDYYKNKPNLEAFHLAVENSKNPLCYNGDLFSVEDVKLFEKMFPQIDTIMMGRGVLTNPNLPRAILSEIKQGGTNQEGVSLSKEQFTEFHNDILEGYRKQMQGDKNVLFKMKELWYYFQYAFENCEKPLKKIKKSQGMDDYRLAVRQLMDSCQMKQPPVFGGELSYGDECDYRG